MDFQTMYQLYDYYCRMYAYYDARWTTAEKEEFFLTNQFIWLADCFERNLANF